MPEGNLMSDSEYISAVASSLRQEASVLTVFANMKPDPQWVEGMTLLSKKVRVGADLLDKLLAEVTALLGAKHELREAACSLLQYLDEHDWGHVPEGATSDRLRDLAFGVGCGRRYAHETEPQPPREGGNT